MPQEVSVSYQAIKSKVYRLIDSLVVGEKTEAEIQESIHRWWDLIHPADRPIAQKYLQAVLGLSTAALEAIGDGLITAGNAAEYAENNRRLKVMERVVNRNSLAIRHADQMPSH